MATTTKRADFAARSESTVTVRCHPETARLVRLLAISRGCQMAELVDQWLREGLERANQELLAVGIRRGA